MVDRPLRLFLLGANFSKFDYEFSSNGDELFCLITDMNTRTHKRLTFFEDGVFLSGTSTRLDTKQLRHHQNIMGIP